MNYRYKVEIELDDEKIIKDGEYELDSIYDSVRQIYAEEGIEELKTNSKVLTFVSKNDDDKEFAKFCAAQNSLLESGWFISAVKRMTWFDTLYGTVSEENILKCAERHGII